MFVIQQAIRVSSGVCNGMQGMHRQTPQLFIASIFNLSPTRSLQSLTCQTGREYKCCYRAETLSQSDYATSTHIIKNLGSITPSLPASLFSACNAWSYILLVRLRLNKQAIVKKANLILYSPLCDGSVYLIAICLDFIEAL